MIFELEQTLIKFNIDISFKNARLERNLRSGVFLLFDEIC